MFKKLALLSLLSFSASQACPPPSFAWLVATYGFEVAKTVVIATIKVAVLPTPTK